MENISVKLPDGSIKQLPKGSTGFDLALSIGPGLAKDAVAIEINNIAFLIIINLNNIR